ncbi:MAG: hypothetical protein SFH39_07975 [Candidatus Magnetobacterium sp. LHC-1]|nr:hypothetical protein [Nitrospirota bacterium]
MDYLFNKEHQMANALVRQIAQDRGVTVRVEPDNVETIGVAVTIKT